MFWVLLLLVWGALLGGFWVIIYSPLFRIKNIEVVGTRGISRDEVVTLLRTGILENSFWKKILGFENILAWPDALSSSDLASLPEFKSISIEKHYRARSVSVRAEERRQFGIWCANRTDGKPILTNGAQASDTNSVSSDQHQSGDESCFWFDDEGVLFKKSVGVEGTLIKLVDDYSQKNLGLNSKMLPDAFIPNMFSIFRALAGSGAAVEEIRLNNLELQEIEVDTYDAASGETAAKQGPKLFFSLRFPSDNAAAVIKSLMAQPNFGKLQYIDFRVENRAYYK